MIERVHQMDLPRAYRDRYEPAELAQSDFETALPSSVAEVWYWYGTGHYEGTGQMIARYETGEWGGADLSHCSCYGPARGMSYLTRRRSFFELTTCYSREAMRDVRHLLKSAELSQGGI